MKIVIASSGLGHVARGVEAWAAELGRALLDRGMNVTVCKGGGEAQDAHERVIKCWQRGSIKTRRLLNWLPSRLTWRLGIGSAYGVEQTSFAIGLIDYLRQQQVDLLHVQDPQVALIVQRARALGLLNTKTILAHGTEESPAFLRKITYLQHLTLWHQADASQAGASKPTWQAIPNFIDTDQFSPGTANDLRAELDIPPNALVMLSVAAIKRKHKRVDYLLNEFAELRRRSPDLPAWLVVAGGAEPRSGELIQEGQRFLGDRVRFLVRFPRQRMPDLYRAADLFTLASLKEMMPIAVLEAMASGLPCLVHQHPVLQWMTGSAMQPINMETPGALAQAATALFHDTQRRQAVSENSRRHCEANFSTHRILDQILDYYHFVLTHGRNKSETLTPYRTAA